MNSRPTKFHSHIIIFFSAANIRVTFESFSCFQQFENKLAYLKLAAFLWIVEQHESSLPRTGLTHGFNGIVRNFDAHRVKLQIDQLTAICIM